MTDFDHLADRKLIEAAQAKLASVSARRAPAAVALAAAAKAYDVAQTAYTDALSGASGADPNVVRLRLDEVARSLSTAQAAIPAIESAITTAESDLRQQTGVAYRGVMQAAVLAVADACKAADVARAALATATADFNAAAEAVRHAINNGSRFTGENFCQSSPSLTKPDGVFVTPTLEEFVTRLAQPMDWFPGLAPNGTAKEISR